MLLEQDLDDRGFLETLLEEYPFKHQNYFFRKDDSLLQFMKSFDGKAIVMLDFNTYPESAIDMLPILKSDARLILKDATNWEPQPM